MPGGGPRGRPQLVACRGEPGVGKTRLARALVGSARGRGFLTGYGTAPESSGAPPYWCWWQGLRGIDEVIGLDELARERGLGLQLSGLWGAAQPALGATPEDRFRLFDAIARLLRVVAQHSPLLVVLDDMHWADDASLRLLQHVAKGMENERLMLLVNARQQPAAGDVDVLAGLLREQVATELPLKGLDRPAVRQQLLRIPGLTVDDDLVGEVQTSTGGNPFFVGEVGRALAGGPVRPGRTPVAASILAAIAERLGGQTQTGAEVVRAAAVLGEEVSVSTSPGWRVLSRRRSYGCSARRSELRCSSRRTTPDGGGSPTRSCATRSWRRSPGASRSAPSPGRGRPGGTFRRLAGKPRLRYRPPPCGGGNGRWRRSGRLRLARACRRPGDEPARLRRRRDAAPPRLRTGRGRLASRRACPAAAADRSSRQPLGQPARPAPGVHGRRGHRPGGQATGPSRGCGSRDGGDTNRPGLRRRDSQDLPGGTAGHRP